MSVFALAKAAISSGVAGGDITKLLMMATEQYGLKVTPMEMAEVPAVEELQAIARSAVAPGAEFFRVTADVGGRSVVAFLVVTSPPKD